MYILKVKQKNCVSDLIKHLGTFFFIVMKQSA